MSLVLKAKALVEAAAFTGFDQTNPVRKVRRWATDVVQYDSRLRQTQQVLDQPMREWFVNWSLIDEAGQNQLREIFDAARGTYDSFLWLDDTEYLASGITITTDGTSTTYQLKCTYHQGESYSWDEDKADIVAGDIYAPVVTHSVDGAQTEVESGPGANQFTLDDTSGVMTFGAAPSAGVLTCTFQYYFRVAFAEDSFEDLQRYPGPLFDDSELHLAEVRE
jgi:uncharacterized protein (TIGR02217 family)